MPFNAIEEITSLVKEIEGKLPTDLVDFFDEKVEYYTKNGITKMMHVGKTEWTRNEAAEWLLSMFLGIVEKGKENKIYYNTFGSWLKHVYHFVIDNKANLK